MIDESTFSNKVRRTFGDLLAEFGYEASRADGYSIRFERTPTFVELDYDAQRSHEVSIWLSDGDELEPPLELVDALRATECEPKDVEGVALMQTDSPADLDVLLQRAAQALRDCGSDFVAGDTNAFAAARELRSQRAESYTVNLQNRSALAAADDAWAAKDYGRVHDLLNPIRDSLGSSYQRRLEFAEKKL